MTKLQEVKNCASHLANVMSPRSFNVNFLFMYDLIYLTSFLGESSTSTHFEVLFYSEDMHMTSPEAFFFAFSRGCFHFTKIYCKLLEIIGVLACMLSLEQEQLCSM